MAKAEPAARIAAQNRKARHNYDIEDTLEAGIVLVGSEVKSLRDGRASIGEAFAIERGGELWLVNAHIPEYKQAGGRNHQPMRPRKLLVHRRERDRLMGAIARDGMSLVPLTVYFNDRGIVKVRLGLGRGKRSIDKREDIKRRDWNRDKARLLRNRNRG